MISYYSHIDKHTTIVCVYSSLYDIWNNELNNSRWRNGEKKKIIYRLYDFDALCVKYTMYIITFVEFQRTDYIIYIFTCIIYYIYIRRDKIYHCNVFQGIVLEKKQFLGIYSEKSEKESREGEREQAFSGL